MILNHNIDNTKCYVRLSHFTKKIEHYDTFHNVYLFGVQSVSGKILTFHGMTDYGMLRSRIPIDQIFFTDNSTKDVPAHFKQLWDCFSENVAVIAYDFLAFHKAEIVLRDGTKIWATYIFTVDWYNNSYSDEPSDYKCGHIFEADNGYLLCQPNNRIFWRDSNWVTKPLPEDLKQFKVDDELISVENKSNRWITEDAGSYYYEITEKEMQK